MKVGLIGKKLDYSLSKELHHIFFKGENIEASYKNIELKSFELRGFMETEIKKMKGINVTIPYKKEVINYLDSVCSKSKALDSVNTILNIDGKLVGYNTDIIGFSLMMERNKIIFKNKTIVILGTGATSRMVKYYSEKQLAKKIITVSRNNKNGSITYDKVDRGDVLINTTPVGTKNINEKPLLEKEIIKNFSTIIEVTYNPFRTRLLIEGIYNNKKIINGMYMLVGQGIKAEELFLNKKIEDKIIEKVYKKLVSKRNIVLIGMPGSGKSIIGKLLSEKLLKEHIDIDKEIVKSSKKSIEKLFQVSENHFRDIESEEIKRIGAMENKIISMGGGSILRESNMIEMYKNGVVIFLDRDIDKIEKNIKNSVDRPLLINDIGSKLKETFKTRNHMYNKYMEIKIDNNGDLENTVNEIIEKVGEI